MPRPRGESDWTQVRAQFLKWLALDPNHASPYLDDGCVFDSDFTVRCGLSPPLK